MTQEDPSSAITGVRYERLIMGAWERFVQGGGLAPGAVPDAWSGDPGCGAATPASTPLLRTHRTRSPNRR